jgi:Recombination endonuclease VII
MHDTELCAHESGCDRESNVRDLCFKHYAYEGKPYRRGLPPPFRVYKADVHGIADVREGTGFCVRCNQRSVLGHGRSCRAGNTSRRRFKVTGWSDEAYDLALIASGNRCHLCSEPGTKSEPLEADHDHGTGKPRSLICGRCNRALGLLRDDVALIRRCATYLEDHRKEP